MISVRCTKKLLDRMSKSPLDHAHSPDNALGDWYAKTVSTAQGEMIAFVSERCLLVVVAPFEDSDQLFADFVERSAQLLAMLDMPDDVIDAELVAMQHIQVTRSSNRRITGSLNEVARQIARLTESAQSDEGLLETVEIQLSELAHNGLGDKTPCAMARELLLARWQGGAGMA